MTPQAWTLLFALLCALFALPALWLVVRRRAHGITLALALLATANGFMAWKLAQASPPIASLPGTPTAFVLGPATPGRFQTIPAGALDQALAQSRGKPVLLDFYADWCSSCQLWNRQIFSRTDVQGSLQPLVLLRIDATEMTPETQAALNRYNLPGLPALISFNTRGQEQSQLRLTGEMSAGEFVTWVHQRLLPAVTL